MMGRSRSKPAGRGRSLNPVRKAAIAREMLERYTGSLLRDFQKKILLTNFHHYLHRFSKKDLSATLIGSTMRVHHNKKLGVSMIDFRIGSPSAALIMELLGVIRPKSVLFLGMCGGLHRDLKVGDFILPMAAIRDEGASKHFMPPQVPALPTFKIQKFVSQILVEKGLDYRTGVVHTTDYRFWEFSEDFKKRLYAERVIGIEMECAALFISGFACRIPIGALLLVSDLPLKRSGIKTKQSANRVFSKFTELHLDIGIQAMSEIAKRGEHIRHYRW